MCRIDVYKRQEFTVSYPVDIVNESKNVELLSMDTIKEIIKDDIDVYKRQ